MNPTVVKGLALFLVLAGVFLALAGAVGALVTRDQRLLFLATAGFVIQFLGWRRAFRAGGA